MFESSLVESRRTRVAAARLAVFPVSVAAHSLLIAAALFLAVWNITFPRNTPVQIDSYAITGRLPVPPPAAPPRGSGQPQQTAVKPAPVRVDMVPLETPDVIPVLTSSAAPALPGAVEGGVDGSPDGTADGVPGGVPGGVSTDSGGPGDDVLQPRPVGNGVKAPEIIARFSPPYPPLAYAARKEGFAAVECIIDKKGEVRSVTVVSSTFGPFGEAAAQAVRQWKFRPGTLNGRPVDTIFILRVDFKLNR